MPPAAVRVLSPNLRGNSNLKDMKDKQCRQYVCAPMNDVSQNIRIGVYLTQVSIFTEYGNVQVTVCRTSNIVIVVEVLVRLSN